MEYISDFAIIRGDGGMKMYRVKGRRGDAGESVSRKPNMVSAGLLPHKLDKKDNNSCITPSLYGGPITPALSRIVDTCAPETMARGNQRDKAREKNLKEQGATRKKNTQSGTEFARTKEQQAAIMRQKQEEADVKKKADAAGGKKW
ncbi:hypothetical protein MMC08_001708 [Hypocenomyce scalaris]|nr:hypothetical protein [Hypocenomyce scalaris]